MEANAGTKPTRGLTTHRLRWAEALLHLLHHPSIGGQEILGAQLLVIADQITPIIEAYPSGFPQNRP